MVLLRLVIGAGSVLLIWKPLVGLTYTFTRGPGARFDLGDNYEMWGPQLSIYYCPSEDRENYTPESIILGPIIEFALNDSWIIGKTGKGLFCINKKLHDVHYPFSKDELQQITGLDISSMQIITNPKPYEIIEPRTLSAMTQANRLCWILIFVLPTTLAFGPPIVRVLIDKWINRDTG